MTGPDLTDDFTADSHADLDPGEGGMMSDAEFYDRTSGGEAAQFWTGEEMTAVENGTAEPGAWVPSADEVYAEAKAENDFAADPPGREA